MITPPVECVRARQDPAPQEVLHLPATLLPCPGVFQELGQWLCVPPFRRGLPFSALVVEKGQITFIYIGETMIQLKIETIAPPDLIFASYFKTKDIEWTSIDFSSGQ